MAEGLIDPAELLFRHVHPQFVRDGRPSSQAFKPSKKNDDGLLSVDRGALTTPSAAHTLFTVSLGLKCGGTWGVTVEECAGAELVVRPDPLDAPPEKIANPAHAVIDFRAFTNNKIDAKSAILARCAHARGRLHPPSSSDDAPAETKKAG